MLVFHWQIRSAPFGDQRAAVRNVKTNLTGLRGLLLGALVLIALREPALAQPNRTNGPLEISYAVTFWDIPIGHTDYEGTLSANSYSAKAHFETGGVIGVFWKSVVNATVSGSIIAHAIVPSLYESDSQNHDRPLQQVKMTFANGQSSVFADPPYDTRKYPVSEEQKRGAVDPMSALTSIFSGAGDAKTPCGSGAEVFDGRRRYNLSFTYVKDEAVKLGNGLFNGNAHLCEIHYDAIAGYPQRDAMAWQTSARIFGDFIEIPAPGLPDGRYVVPVKLWSVRSLGTMTVTLDRIRVDGSVPTSMNARTE
jgi:Protein of unknown function (DUF3108)